MGYYTYYKLSVYGKEPDNLDEVIFKETDNYFRSIQDINRADRCKWYSHEKDMKAISKVFPDVHFLLTGEGEEPGDIWEKHFLAGKMQVCRAEIVIPEFDPNKLE